MGENKKIVRVELCNKGKDVEYTGRCLGLITPEEYSGIVDTPSLRNKITTVSTMELSDIGSLDVVEDMRLIMTVKSKDNVKINKKKLFVSEPLEHISQFKANDEITLVGKNGSFVFVTEEVVNEAN
jgi:hypothetical protein